MAGGTVLLILLLSFRLKRIIHLKYSYWTDEIEIAGFIITMLSSVPFTENGFFVFRFTVAKRRV